MRLLDRTAPRILPQAEYFLWPFLGTGPHGNPLIYYDPSVTDTIGLSDEVYSGLTTEQQSWADAAGRTWTDYSALWADVSVQSWFNDQNIMGALDGGIIFYPSDASRYTLNRGLVWLGLPPILVYAQSPDEETMIGPDETPIEVI